jgi:hypothetical protein
VAQLKAKYREVFGEESRADHKRFPFRRRIAWRIPANAWGGLSERAGPNALDRESPWETAVEQRG